MMVDRCLPAEDLADILALPDDDERRRHVDDCPRCRTLARRYRDFLSPAPLPPEADAEAASRALRDRLVTALPELAPSLEAEDATSDRRVHIDWRPTRRSWRPFVAVAAVLVCCLGLLSIRDQLLEPAPEPGIMRGDDLGPAALVIDGTAAGFDLSWGLPDGTDQVEIVLIDAALVEIERIGVGPVNQHRLATVPDAARYVRVDFVSTGDVVATTRTLPLARVP
jgi:hypothetical protein